MMIKVCNIKTHESTLKYINRYRRGESLSKTTGENKIINAEGMIELENCHVAVVSGNLLLHSKLPQS